MNKAFHLQIEQNGIASLRFTGNASQNLNEEIFQEFSKLIEHLSVNALIKVLVIKSAHPEIFCSGIDYQSFEDLKEKGQLKAFIENTQKCFLKLYALPFPVVAFIDGLCRAEGFELALFCHYRFATKNALFSLPQVSLGLCPFLGATQRLPHLIGIRKSFALVLGEETFSAKQAMEASLLDAYCLEEKSENVLKEFLQKTLSSRGHAALQQQHKGFHRFFLENNPITRPWLFYRAELGYQGPAKDAVEKTLELVHEGFSLSLEEGLKRESDTFLSLEEQNLSKNLRRLFYTKKDLQKSIDAFDIKQIAIFGAGKHGGDVAFICKEQSIPCRIAAESWGKISQSYERACHTRDQKIEKISATRTWDGCEKVDCLFETSFLEEKVKILEKAEETVASDCPIFSFCPEGSHTHFQETLQDPARFFAISLLNKEDPFIEVLQNEQQSQESFQKMLKIFRRLEKIPLVVSDAPFLQERIVFSYVNEAMLMLEEGIKAQRIESLCKSFAFRKSPLQYCDQIGLGEIFQLGKQLSKRQKKPYKVSQLLEVLSIKNFPLFYQRGRVFFDEQRFLLEKRQSLIDDKGITDRLIFSIINECFFCLEEKLLQSPEILDWAIVEGFGFPKKYGGPIAYAQEFRLSNCVNKLKQLSLEYGKRFDPSALLLTKARQQESFF